MQDCQKGYAGLVQRGAHLDGSTALPDILHPTGYHVHLYAAISCTPDILQSILMHRFQECKMHEGIGGAGLQKCRNVQEYAQGA